MAFARAVGEYGSIIFIAGNMPMVSEIAPLLIVTKLEQYDYAGAAAIGVVMLAAAFVMLLALNGLQSLGGETPMSTANFATPTDDPLLAASSLLGAHRASASSACSCCCRWRWCSTKPSPRAWPRSGTPSSSPTAWPRSGCR